MFGVFSNRLGRLLTTADTRFFGIASGISCMGNRAGSKV